MRSRSCRAARSSLSAAGDRTRQDLERVDGEAPVHGQRFARRGLHRGRPSVGPLVRGRRGRPHDPHMGVERRCVITGGNAATLQASTFAHGESVLRLAYSPDGAILASAGADRVIKLWDAATLREKQAFEAQPDWVMGLALSADGKWLAAGRYDGTLGLYGSPAAVPGNSSSSAEQ